MTLLFTILTFWGIMTPMKTPTENQDLQSILESINYDPVIPYDQEVVRLPGLVMELYYYNQFNEIWYNEQQVLEFIELIGKSTIHGFNPDDYHYSFLKRYYDRRNEDNNLALYYDIMLSDASFFYSHHLTNGRVDRIHAETWNYPAREDYLTYVEVYFEYLKNGLIVQRLEDQAPKSVIYKKLIQKKQEFQKIRKEHGEITWIPDDVTIKPGEENPLIGDICNRIKLLGYTDQDFSGNTYTEAHQKVVENFQSHHGLEADGVIGKSTFDMLNMTLRKRIGIIDINLERIRWARSGLDNEQQDAIIVNIAGFHLYLIKDEKLIWDTDVMVGTIDTQTPIFGSDIKYVVFNPTWTVPRSIINKGMFNRIKKDPSYLARNNYYLANRKGQRVDANTIDWNSMTLNKFGYSVVQAPGAGNALGRVKFIFPNKYSIYLHDTPSKYLFAKTSRAFSHGCIRVKDPLKLAELLLEDKDGYGQKDINKIIGTEKTKTVFLSKKLRVLILYMTVDIGSDGEINFHPDVYKRDERIIAAYQRLKEEIMDAK